MAVPTYPPHILIQFGGTLECVSGQDEIWSCNIRGFPGTGGPGAMFPDPSTYDLGPFCDAVGAAIQTWFTSSAGGMASTAELGFVKANCISANGKYSNESTTFEFTPTGTRQGDLSPTAPSYMSLAYSWVTAKVRGRGSKGRIFPPNYCWAYVGAAANSAAQGAAVTSAIALFNAINISTGLDGGIFSPAVVSSFGEWNLMTGVRVGNLYDHQTRRRNAVDESYVSGSFSG